MLKSLVLAASLVAAPALAEPLTVLPNGLPVTELTVDGGICDRWRLPWDQIDAIAPPPEVLRDKLTQGSFVLISLRVRERRKRRPAILAHAN